MPNRLTKLVDVCVLMLVVILIVINVSGYIFHKPVVAVVKGISMEPLLHTGDIVLINPFDDEPRLGQVVVYLNDVNEYVIHRVVAIIKCSNGTTLYVTKGDNDPLIDPEDIAILKSASCRGIAIIATLGNDVARQVHACPRGLPRSDIVGTVFEIGSSVVKIFGLSPSVG